MPYLTEDIDNTMEEFYARTVSAENELRVVKEERK